MLLQWHLNLPFTLFHPFHAFRQNILHLAARHKTGLARWPEANHPYRVHLSGWGLDANPMQWCEFFVGELVLRNHTMHSNTHTYIIIGLMGLNYQVHSPGSYIALPSCLRPTSCATRLSLSFTLYFFTANPWAVSPRILCPSNICIEFGEETAEPQSVDYAVIEIK